MSSTSELVRREGNTLVFPGVKIDHIKAIDSDEEITELFDIRIDIQNFPSNFACGEADIQKIQEAAAKLFIKCYDPTKISIQYSKGPEKCTFGGADTDLNNEKIKPQLDSVRTIWDTLFSAKQSDDNFIDLSAANPSTTSSSPSISQPPSNGVNVSAPTTTTTTTSSSSPNVLNNTSANANAEQNSSTPPTRRVSSIDNLSNVGDPEDVSAASQPAANNISQPLSNFGQSSYGVNTSSSSSITGTTPQPANTNVSEDMETVVQKFIESNQKFKSTFPGFSIRELQKNGESISQDMKSSSQGLRDAYSAYCSLLDNPNSNSSNVVLMRALLQSLYAFKLREAENNSSTEIKGKREEEKKRLAAESTASFVSVQGKEPSALIQWLIKNPIQKK